MGAECGLLNENGNMEFPAAINLSAEKLQPHGLYLMFDNQSMYLYVGAQANPHLLQDVFDKQFFGEVATGKVKCCVSLIQ
jgi:protein transport protein SEC24